MSARQERFAQLVSQGMSYTASYIESYQPNQRADTVINPKASNLAKKDKVQTRIKELMQENSVSSSWDRRRLLEATQRVHDKSIEKNQMATALKSLELIGRICGLLIDKSEVKVEHTLYSSLSMELLERIANQADSIPAPIIIESLTKDMPVSALETGHDKSRYN